MSRDDYETGQTLINPYIEIGRGQEPNPRSMAYVNVETFRECLGHLIRSRTENGPRVLDFPFYSVYGVVGNTVSGGGNSYSYINIGEPPVSRTLMGYLPEEILKQELPKTHKVFVESAEETS